MQRGACRKSRGVLLPAVSRPSHGRRSTHARVAGAQHQQIGRDLRHGGYRFDGDCRDTKRGIIPCPGGSLRTPDKREAILAISWKQVKNISDQFAALSPYSRDIIPDSILKLE